METQIFSDFWIVGWSFILIILSVLYYAPKLLNQHFEAIDKMQDKFWASLDRITDKNTNIAEWFILQLGNITKEHELQNKKLDEIHTDIKNLHKNKWSN